MPQLSGSFASAASSRIDHELLRSLILNASFTAGHDSYRRISRGNDIVVVGAGFRRLINRATTTRSEAL